MKIKSSVLMAISLTVVSASLFPIAAQAEDDCDIRLNPCRGFSAEDGYIHLTGKLFDLTPSISLSSPQSRVELTLITPSEAVLSAWGVTQHETHISCQLDEKTNFYVGYSSALGVTSDVIFQGKSETITSSTSARGEHSLVTASFGVPQSATLGTFTCTSGLQFSGGNESFGDGYTFTLSLNRTFTPSKPTPSASSSPSVTSSPTPRITESPSSRKNSTDTGSSEVVVGGNADSESEFPSLAVFLEGTLGIWRV